MSEPHSANQQVELPNAPFNLDANIYVHDPGFSVVLGQTVAGKAAMVCWINSGDPSYSQRLAHIGEEVWVVPSERQEAEDIQPVGRRAMTHADKIHIVTNALQTDTESLVAAVERIPSVTPAKLSVLSRKHSPGSPILPSITGVINVDRLGVFEYFADVEAVTEYDGLPIAVNPGHHTLGGYLFDGFELPGRQKLEGNGFGLCLTTYEDGMVAPIVKGSVPYLESSHIVTIPGEDAAAIADGFYQRIESSNLVALAAKTIDPKTGIIDINVIYQ